MEAGSVDLQEENPIGQISFKDAVTTKIDLVFLADNATLPLFEIFAIWLLLFLVPMVGKRD